MKKSSPKNKRPLNIAILSRAAHPFHNYGGLERHIYYQAKHLARLGCNIILITEPPAPGCMQKLDGVFKEKGRVDVKFVSRRPLPLPRRGGFIILDRLINYLFSAKAMVETIRQDAEAGRFDCVIAHGLTGWAAGRMLRKIPNKPKLMLNPHGMEEFKHTNIIKKILYYPFRRKMASAARDADMVVATDKIMIPQVRECLKVGDEKIVMLPNAIDVEEALGYVSVKIQKDLRERFGLKKGELMLASVGRLEANKGHLNLINQMARIKDKIKKPWKLIIVGKGSQRLKLETAIAETGLQDRIILAGTLNDAELHNLYELADIFVLPSLFEGSSIATLEAMIHKCAIIANAVGGLPDKVQPGINGFLCDTVNLDEIGDAIFKIGNESSFIITLMCEKSSDYVRNFFSWQCVVQKLFNFCKSNELLS